MSLYVWKEWWQIMAYSSNNKKLGYRRERALQRSATAIGVQFYCGVSRGASVSLIASFSDIEILVKIARVINN